MVGWFALACLGGSLLVCSVFGVDDHGEYMVLGGVVLAGVLAVVLEA